MRKLILITAACISFNASASEYYCDAKEVATVTSIAVASGVVIGAVVGGITAAIMPVGATGGPMAIMYFPGNVAFWSWIKLSVIPIAGGTALLSGGLFGVVAYAGISEKCAAYLNAQATKVVKAI